MCGGGGVGKLADNIKGQIKEAQTPKRAGQMLLSGGASSAAQISDNGKTLDSMGRKNLLGESREAGILPDAKVKVDPAAERAAASAEATTQANARIALMRKAQRDNSLVTGGGNAARGTLGV